MTKLSPNQSFALDDETRTAADLIGAGVQELRRLDGGNDRAFAPMLLLSVGFERLLKLTLILSVLARTGNMPTSRDIRQLGGRNGHDIALLTSKLVERARTDGELAARPACDQDLDFLSLDNLLGYAVTTLSAFAETTRYYHLNALLDTSQRGANFTDAGRMNDPLAAWGALEQGLFERHVDQSQKAGPDGLAWDYEAIADEATTLFQRYARAVCRMWTLGSLGRPAQQFSPHLYPFIMLRDEDLNKPAPRRPGR